MSAARRTDGRAQARRVNSSPYARPRTATTGWSLSRLFEPIRRRVFGYQEDDEESPALPVQVHASYLRTPARSDNIPGQFVKSPTPEGYTGTEETGLRRHETMLSIGAPEPPRSTTNSPKRRVPSPGLTPTDTLEKVVEFLTEAAGTPLKQGEAEGVTGLIQQAIPGETMVSQALSQSAGRILSALEVEGSISVLRRRMEPRHEPFRFQSVDSSRDASPAPPSSNPKTPRRTLKRNPNGPYRWDGVGSAKQNRRNRYASPAFGTPQITPEKPKSDGKRRRVDNTSSPPPTDSLPASKLPYPITTPQASRSNAPTTPKLTVNTTTPSRLRTPSITKPTTPSQPSPLRQTWQLSPTNSNEDLQQSSPPPGPRPSETASLMSQLIKEATPPKRPDLSNPYQTASPIAKVGPPRRSTRRTKVPTRAEQPNGKDVEEKKKQEAEQMDDIPAQAFIEATVPKGSKRSRPPTNLEKPSEPEPSQPSKAPFSLPAADQPEADRSPKKAKGVSFSAQETGSSSKDVPMANGTSGAADKAPSTSSLFGGSGNNNNAAPSARPAFNSLKATSAPSRPSNLRFSYQPEGNSAPSSPTSNDKTKEKEKEKADVKDAEMSAPPPPTVVSSFGLSPLPPGSSNSNSSFSPFIVPSAPRVTVKSGPSRSRADVKMDSDVAESDPKAAAAGLRAASLPVFTFTMHVRADTSFLKAQNDAKSTPLGSLPKFDFTLVPAPSTSFAASSPATMWTCSTCSLKNPDSAKDKCQICEAERPASAPVAPAPATKSFDWSAAGMAPPSSSAGSTWTCSTCGLSNPASATEKCDICDAERPGVSAKATSGATAPAPAPTPTPVVKAFDWSAAGMAPPAPPTDKWTCGTCMCSNGKDEAKCTVCETPR